MNNEYKGVCDLITWVILKDLEGAELRNKQLEFIDALDMHAEDYQEFFDELFSTYFDGVSVEQECLQLKISSITKGHAVTDFDDFYQRSDALEKELLEWRKASPNYEISIKKQEQ